MPSDATTIESTIMALLSAAGPGRTVSPTEVAQAQHPGTDWHVLMPAVRRSAVQLALAGHLVIYRKGKPVDPTDFRGVYRLGLPRHD
jgi:hypothetical protein